jgi:hypothetical protein
MMAVVWIRVKAIIPLIDEGFRVEYASIFDSFLSGKFQRLKMKPGKSGPKSDAVF